MRIVIVGDGKVGSALSEELSSEGHNVVVIDSNKAVLRDALEEMDVMVVHGNGAALEVQKAADVGESDLLIAATSADETNLLCCVLARKLGCPHTIARVRNPDYAQQLFALKEDLGLSMTVNPELEAAREIFRMLQFPSFLARDSFAKGRVEIVEIELRAGSGLIGRKISEIGKIAREKVLVCSVERGDDVYIPDGSFALREGDIIFVTASSANLAKLIRNLGLGWHKVRNALLIGGSRIAHYLSQSLLDAGVAVKIIERDAARCTELAAMLPKAVVIHGDGTARRLLDAEGIARTDAVVTLTNMDEENLIVSMYADFKGVPKVVTKMNRTEYYEVFHDKGIDSVVSPKELCTSEIVRYVRSMRNMTDDAILTLHRIGKMEALEFRATENTDYLGVPLKDIALKPDVLIACINRKNQIIFPSGEDAVELGDTVIVVDKVEASVYDLNDIFLEPEDRNRARENPE